MQFSISLPDELLEYMDKRVTDRSVLIESLLQEWRRRTEVETMVEAAFLLDGSDLSWDNECQQAMLTDWEASGL
ncbi:hypothetical protein [Gloeobacter violaceus]|uniref:Gsr4049 protein n=1 Tax=Gloeobacter violaceus (strain ATCC 29082 / PCC 7421) TaxID=251221 RepID=Q7NE31_GLOVI|nr:hypothetical protein [Gloeobacter violaceus]BAC91990.1 gsr4049 [Gloeobacter violaceus PCC 7421]